MTNTDPDTNKKTDTDTGASTETDTDTDTETTFDTNTDIPEEIDPFFFARLPRPGMPFVDLWLINHDVKISTCPGAERRLLPYLFRPQMMIPRCLAPAAQICLASPGLATFHDVSKSLRGQGMQRH